MQPPTVMGRTAGMFDSMRARRLLLAPITLLAGLAITGAPAAAQLPVAYQFEGPLNYAVTGASLRNGPNGSNACSVGNSASASLSGIPSGATIEAAYLYWAGSGGNADNTVTFRGTSVTAPNGSRWSDSYTQSGNTFNFFGARADVTALISGNGSSTLSGLSVSEGSHYCDSEAVLAAWSLVVVYRHSSQPLRRVTLWNGFDVLREQSGSVTLSGFMAAPAPDARVSMVTLEGDPTLSGSESLTFNGTSLDGSGDVFNSTTDYGLDIDSYNVSGTVVAGSRSATLQYSTGPDLMIAQYVVASVSMVTVDVTPKGVPPVVERLPGTGYREIFSVENTSLASDNFDILVSRTGSPSMLQVDSITGPGLSTVNDSARVSIPGGATRAYSVWYRVPAGAAATNTLRLRARSVTYPTRSEATSEGFLNVERLSTSPDLVLGKTASPGFSYGQTSTYTFQVTNAGAAPTSSAIVVTDTLPAGVGYVSATGTGWVFTSSNAAGRDIVTATYAQTGLAAAASRSFSMTVMVQAPGTSVTNQAWVSGGGDTNTANNSASVTSSVAGSADLGIAKEGPPNLVEGVNAAYTITLTNVGNAATSGSATSGIVTVVDTLPAGLTFVSGSGPTVITGSGFGTVTTSWTFTVSGNVVTATRAATIFGFWPVSPAPIEPGASVALTLTVTPGAAAAPSVTNRAIVAGGNQVNPLNDTSSVTTPVGALVNLAVTKTASALTQFANGAYTVTVNNIGSAPSAGAVTVADTLPAGIDFVSASGAGWTFVQAGNVVAGTYAATIAGGASAVFSINVSVGAAAASVTNRAHLSGGGDVTPANNTGSVTSAVTLRPDLTVSKTSQTFAVGQVGRTYTITVQNIGGLASSGTVTVVDTLPAGLVWQSATGSGWSTSWNAAARTMTATRSAAIAAGASAPAITLVVTISADAYPSVTNAVRVSGGADAVNSNNSAVLTTAVTGVDIIVEKASSPSFTPGQQGTYTVRLVNIGSATSAGAVTVRDTLPLGVAYVSHTGAGWNLATGGVLPDGRQWGDIVYTGAAMAPGANSTIVTMTVTVTATGGTSLTNRAHASGGGDANLANNVGTVTTPVSGTPVLTVAIAATPGGAVQSGTDVQYTVTFFNQGNALALDAVVEEQLPPDLVFKVNSVSLALPPGITATTEYWNGLGWSYVPVSGGCGAPAGYDACVQRLRWPMSTPVVPGGSGDIVLQGIVK